MGTLETLELVGGELCLDFANTINSRREPEHDYLASYADLLEWSGKLAILDTAAASHLHQPPSEFAEGALQQAHHLRALVYRLFSTLAQEGRPSSADSTALMQQYGEAIQHARVQARDGGFEVRWDYDSPAALLGPVTNSAVQLLLSDEISQIKECPSCGWLFVDRSRNKARRWCSMDTCGARAKMRRYYRRQRGSTINN